MKMNLWSLLKDQYTFVNQEVTRTFVTQQRYGRVNTKHGFYLDTSHLPNCGTTLFNRSAESIGQRHILTKKFIFSPSRLKSSWSWNICNGSWWEDCCTEGIWLDMKAQLLWWGICAIYAICAIWLCNAQLVSCPTRLSSSWRWRPQIALIENNTNWEKH